MKKSEAVKWLQVWKEKYVPKYNLDYGWKCKSQITSGLENVYLCGLVDELIERIRNSSFDPVTEVAMYYYEMDEILATSDDDHFITHRFASYMEEAAHDILSFLQKKDAHDYATRNLRKQVMRRRINDAIETRGLSGNADDWLV